MSVAALILAKGNSTRVHNKNTRLCGGKKLIEWPIDAALQSKCIDTVFVSTDGAEIKELAFKKGCYVIDRPYQLSQPYSGGGVTQVHALKQIMDVGFNFDHMFSMWATSPLIQAWQLDDAYQKFITAYWAKQLTAVCKVKASAISHFLIHDEAKNQLLSPYGLQGAPVWNNLMNWVRTTGAFGIYNPNILDYSKLPEITSNMTYLEIEGIYTPAQQAWNFEGFAERNDIFYAYPIDEMSALDINTEDDLLLADFYLKMRKEKQDARGN